MNVNNCKYQRNNNTCSIDGNPCFDVEGFENWECLEYEEEQEG